MWCKSVRKSGCQLSLGTSSTSNVCLATSMNGAVASRWSWQPRKSTMSSLSSSSRRKRLSIFGTSLGKSVMSAASTTSGINASTSGGSSTSFQSSMQQEMVLGSAASAPLRCTFSTMRSTQRPYSVSSTRSAPTRCTTRPSRPVPAPTSSTTLPATASGTASKYLHMMAQVSHTRCPSSKNSSAMQSRVADGSATPVPGSALLPRSYTYVFSEKAPISELRSRSHGWPLCMCRVPRPRSAARR
mmetsp:Transcript_18797/g.57116  ORF Transcript_18797/g.57116 Transcript_18797/m.57116 type:complete len:243 (-) Transcript_18797:129-857(-)